MSARRDYRLSDGTRVPGVTTIIGRFKESGGLLWWANRLAYEPLGQARALLGQAYKALYNGPSKDLLGHIADFLETPLERYDHQKAAQHAADAGTLAHAMVERYLKGEDPHDGIEGAWPVGVVDKANTAFLAFLEWAQQTNLEVVESELALVSEKHRVGGTLDCCVLSVQGKTCIGDFKTGQGIYVDALVQVAEYGEIYREHNPGAEIHGYYIFRFDKETADFTVRFLNNLDDGVKAFGLMRELYDLMKALEKRVK